MNELRSATARADPGFWSGLWALLSANERLRQRVAALLAELG